MFSDLRRAICPSDRSPSLRRPRSRARLWVFGVLVVASAACSKQGEGERCDTLNASEDCDDGLTCTDLSTFRAGAPGAICCPANPTQDICRNGGLDVFDDAGATTESPSPRVDGGDSGEPILTEAGVDVTSLSSGSASDAAAAASSDGAAAQSSPGEQSTLADATTTDPSSTSAIETSAPSNVDAAVSTSDAGQ